MNSLPDPDLLPSAARTLELLQTQLTADLQLCTTREQHIRLVQRLSLLAVALNELAGAEELG